MTVIRGLIAVAVFLFMSTSYANTFNCTIKDISTSMSADKFVLVEMSCDSSSPIASGTNGCTAASVSKTSFTFDASTEFGKTNLSIAMMAFASRKRIYASTYATCPTEMNSVPILYGMKVFGD